MPHIEVPHPLRITHPGFIFSIAIPVRLTPSHVPHRPLLRQALDTNGDNVISAREFSDGMTRWGLGLAVVQIEELVALLDHNNNGTIDRQEWDGFMAEMKRKMPETRDRVEDMPFCERNLLASVVEMKSLNKELRTKTRSEVKAWHKKHMDSPVTATHRNRALMPYTRFPCGEDVLANFGRPHVYTRGWGYKTRVTALEIPGQLLLKLTASLSLQQFRLLPRSPCPERHFYPAHTCITRAADTKKSSALQVADHGQSDGTLPESVFNVTHKARSRVMPKRSVNLAQTIMMKDPLEKMLPTLDPTDQFYVWSYRNKVHTLDTLSGHDTTGKGYMSAARITWVYKNILGAPSCDVIADLLAQAPKRNIGRFKNVIDFGKFVAHTSNLGVRKYNVVRERAVLRQKFPSHKSHHMEVNKPTTRAAITALQRDVANARAKREKAKIELEFRATREESRSQSKRNCIEKTLEAYSGSKSSRGRSRTTKPGCKLRQVSTPL
jgi:hypothetical protein